MDASSVGLFRDDWRLADCLRVLYRRKAMLAGLTCLGVLLAAILTARQPRLYRSRATLEVQPVNESFLELRDVYPSVTTAADAPVYLQTQVELLQQDSLLEQVAEKLNLRERPEYRSARGLIPQLRQDVTVAPLKNSRIIQVAFDARSASLAADLANTLATTFIEDSVRTRQEAARQTYQSVLPQLAELQRTMRPAIEGSKAGPPPPQEAANRRVYEAMLQKADYARIASHLNSSNIRLVGRAQPARLPHQPNLPLNLGIGFIGGLLLAVGTVMLQEQHKDVLRAPGDAATLLELPELGVIPQARSLPGAFAWAGGARAHIERVATEQRAGLSESFRGVAASILSEGNGCGHPRLLVVTSSQATEGKTTIVSNLGIALAAVSRKVLLIDADMRRPRLHKLFDEANSWGLSDLLREKNAIDELPLDVLAKRTTIPHLYLLPSGAATDNIFELLHSERMSRLLPLFRKEFDYVLVDAPPCLEFADARIVARYAEQLVLVVRANYTDRRTVHAVVQRLRLDGVPLMSVILNRWDPAPGDPYAYRAFRSAIRQGAL